MQTARIAAYDITSGSFDEIANRAERDLLAVFKAQPGFRAYGLVRVKPATLISVSLWSTEDAAYDAVDTAAAWVQDNVNDQVKLRATYIGDVAFWSSVAPIDFSAMQRPIPG